MSGDAKTVPVREGEALREARGVLTQRFEVRIVEVSKVETSGQFYTELGTNADGSKPRGYVTQHSCEEKEIVVFRASYSKRPSVAALANLLQECE